jgi:hypothetical protein
VALRRTHLLLLKTQAEFPLLTGTNFGSFTGPLLEPRLKPGHPLLYDLLYLSGYKVDH